MNPKKNTIAVTFRCDVKVAEQLDDICRMMGIKRSEFLITAITTEYDRIQGSPTMKEMMESMKRMTEIMKQMTGQGKGNNDGSEGEEI